MEDFQQAMSQKGWALFDSVVDDEFVGRLKGDVERAYEVCRCIQVENSVGAGTNGALHHVLGLGESFAEFLERMYLVDQIKQFLQCNVILNSYGGVINKKNNNAYLHNIHRDLRLFSGHLPLMINVLVMLDDFTLENGATYVLSGSHRTPEKPTESDFFNHADRFVGKQGSIVLFDSNLWHATGKNETERVRRALTLTYTRPFIKQQLDYPRYLGYERMAQFSEGMKQILGYNARVPANLNEWYQPTENRFYKADQG